MNLDKEKLGNKLRSDFVMSFSNAGAEHVSCVSTDQLHGRVSGAAGNCANLACILNGKNHQQTF